MISNNQADYSEAEINEMLEEIVNNYADGERWGWIRDKEFIDGLYKHYANGDYEAKPFSEKQKQSIVNIWYAVKKKEVF